MGKNKKRKNSAKQDSSEPKAKEAKITENVEVVEKVEDEGAPVVAVVAKGKKNMKKGKNAKKNEVVESTTNVAEEKVEKPVEGNGVGKEENEDNTDNSDEKEENEDENEDSKEENKEDNDKGKKKPEEKKQAPPKQYVLFIGNLPYDVKKEDLKAHFSDCQIKDIRLSKDPKTNRTKGFGYLELETSTDFEKAFCKNHTFISGRRINVELPNRKKDDNKKVHKKGLKLKAMRDKGLLAGSTKKTNKRSFRREKKLKMERNQDKD